MMGELKKIGNAASRWVKKNPDTKNNYKDYEIFAEDLWNALKSRIPTLLELSLIHISEPTRPY